MAKTKTPFFSLDASGTVGQAVTAQRRGSATLLRAKPLPAYRYSLPQAYQRWLYQDYAYRWRQEDATTRQEYSTLGSRCHLTGFQYYMRVSLSTLPALLGWWTLDRTSPASAIDRSPFTNHGTVFGASPQSGVIEYGYHFDGLNDYIRIPDSPNWAFNTDPFTIEFFFRLHDLGHNSLITQGTTANDCWIIFYHATRGMRFLVRSGAVTIINCTEEALTEVADRWYYLTCTRSNNTFEVRLDNVLKATVVSAASILDYPGFLKLGTYPTLANWLHGDLDNVVIYNRALDETERLRHMERGYPS